jgi:hypothetical protein
MLPARVDSRLEWMVALTHSAVTSQQHTQPFSYGPLAHVFPRGPICRSFGAFSIALCLFAALCSHLFHCMWRVSLHVGHKKMLKRKHVVPDTAAAPTIRAERGAAAAAAAAVVAIIDDPAVHTDTLENDLENDLPPAKRRYTESSSAPSAAAAFVGLDTAERGIRLAPRNEPSNGRISFLCAAAEEAARLDMQGMQVSGAARGKDVAAASVGALVPCPSVAAGAAACMTCGKAGIALCGSCGMVYYCSRSCQLAHFNDHSQMCRAFRRWWRASDP